MQGWDEQDQAAAACCGGAGGWAELLTSCTEVRYGMSAHFELVAARPAWHAVRMVSSRAAQAGRSYAWAVSHVKERSCGAHRGARDACFLKHPLHVFSHMGEKAV